MPAGRHTDDILKAAQAALTTAEVALRALLRPGPAASKRAGLRNLITFGRAVIGAVEDLRETEPTFESWYAPIAREVAADELLGYFSLLRSGIVEEEGAELVPASAAVQAVGSEGPPGPPPPGARSFLVGRDQAISGWQVELPDGSLGVYYSELPSDAAVSATLHFLDPPERHLGLRIGDTSVENLARLYFSYLRQLVGLAERRFGGAR